MFSYNAIDQQMKPFIILPHIEQLPFHFGQILMLISQHKTIDGWQLHYLHHGGIHFISELNLIRASLHSEIREQKAVLILDNHSSRINSKAITLPLHCTHVLQLFDVGVAASLKAKITKLS